MTSIDIISREAELFAETVLILLERVKKCSVLGLYGGVFQHNESFVKTFSEKIKTEYPAIVIKMLDMPPEIYIKEQKLLYEIGVTILTHYGIEVE